MRVFDEIQKEIKEEFETYFNSLLFTNGIPRKYFYWTVDFFRCEGNLSFNFFQLSTAIKDELNDLGRKYFKTEEVYFNVNKNSHRHDLTVFNFNKIFDESNKKEQTLRYEYIKEFIFWKLLVAQKEKHDSDLIVLTKQEVINPSRNRNKIIDQLIQEIDQLNHSLSLQKNNFLWTYVQYVTLSGRNIENRNYVTFSSILQTQYEKIIEDLNLIQNKTSKDNKELRKKIDSLFIHKSFKSKIHFLFSKEGGEGKEELRELLDIMGGKDNGDYYRGQANSSWIVDASITREEKYLLYESDMYYDILSLKPEAFKNDNSVYERLITMQHYGLPTRLLDITRNPLVAIFFACNNLERKESDGIIFSYLPNDERQFLNFEDDKLDSLESIYKKGKSDSEFLKGVSFLKGVAKNQRINSQSGDFIFVGTGENTLIEVNNLAVLNIIIDADAKKALLEQLESLNIHAGSVYPDLTTVSKYISHKYKNLPSIKRETKQIDSIVAETEAEYKVNKTSTEFWTNNRKSQFKHLIKGYNLIEKETKDLIDYFLDHNEFLEHRIIGALHSKPNLLEMDRTREAVKSLLLDFIKNDF